MSIADQLVTNPTTQAAIAAVVAAILDLARGVGPRRAVIVYSPARKALAFLLHPLSDKLIGRPLVRNKTDSGEYILATDLGRVEIAKRLWAAGYRFNPTATVKFLMVGEKRYWEVLSVGQRTENGRWHHVYVVKVGGGYEVWGHIEAPPDDPDDHTQGGQTPGDWNGTVQEAFA